MRCFSEDINKGSPKETIVLMSLKEAKMLIDALEYQCESLPKSKTIKQRKLLEELQNKWCIY